MRVYVLVLNGVFDTGLATVLDAFGTANELAAMTANTSLRFHVSVVGVRKSVTTLQGLRVPIAPASPKRAPDVVVVPAIGTKMPEALLAALAQSEVREAGAVLRRWAARGAVTTAACIGTFVLAESSLLDGQEATTTWWLAPLFRQRYPQVKLDASRIIVHSNTVITAGAALSHLDLALALIRRASPELAGLTARYLVVDSRSSQAIYSIPNHLAHADPMVERFERWARARLAEGFSLDQAEDLRVERAVHLLTTSNASVDQIAAQVGYEEGVTLRALLRRRLGRGVREIRQSAIVE